MKLSIHKINDDFLFCQGHIGKSNFQPYLNLLPKIDFVYCSLPKPENFRMWYSLANKTKISHEQFTIGLAEIFNFIDADEYHIEVGKSNKKDIVDIFQNNYHNQEILKYYHEHPILYSAPLNGRTTGMAKCRNNVTLISFCKYPVEFRKFEYSHDFLEHILNRNNHLNCFDPVIGKGLLVRYAIKYGHSCYGIDMNSERLKCSLEYAKNHLKDSNKN